MTLEANLKSYRWTPKRKEAVVTMIEVGKMTLGEALNRYRLTLDELRSWGLSSWRGTDYNAPWRIIRLTIK